MFDGPHRSGSADRTSFRINHRPSRTIPVWQADRELSGTGAAGGLERESATTGAYHQTGEFNVALLDGGSGPGHSSQPSGMAQQVFPLDDAPGPEDRQGCDGPATGHSFVLDVAQGMGLRASEKVRFTPGQSPNIPWSAL